MGSKVPHPLALLAGEVFSSDMLPNSGSFQRLLFLLKPAIYLLTKGGNYP
jgi:hypothetical protein